MNKSPSSVRSVRRCVALALSVLLSWTLTPPALAQTAGVERLIVAIPGYENNLTPFTVSFLALPNTHDLLTLVYDTLFWSQNDKNPEPWLAESATPSADRKQWTVKLRSGITWHDGKPFTADDVKFSFDYYATYLGRRAATPTTPPTPLPTIEPKSSTHRTSGCSSRRPLPRFRSCRAVIFR